MGLAHDRQGLVRMLMHHKTWLISTKDTDTCFQTLVLIEFTYGKRKFLKGFAGLENLTKFVGPDALPPRHGMIDANMPSQMLT